MKFADFLKRAQELRNQAPKTEMLIEALVKLPAS
jgi:hypothetical protein